MKGIMGIWIALGLGVLGAFCNWFYLANEAANFEVVNFIAISDSRPINPGDKFNETDFVRLPIPKANIGNLDRTAVKWEIRNTALGLVATHAFERGQILLESDLDQPPLPDVQSNLGPGETATWVALDTRSVVPSLLKAGDYVSFIAPGEPRTPTPAGARSTPPSQQRLIGPYRIVAMGNRLGTSERLKIMGTGTTQENMMAVAVKLDPSGEMDAAGQELTTALKISNFQLQVLLHKEAPKKKG